MAKVEKYVSIYNNEVVIDEERQYLVQYIDETNKTVELKTRKEIMSRRPSFDDYRATPYFETRCKNLLDKLWSMKTGEEFVDCLIKNTSVSMSAYFRYRDVMDIIRTKKNTLDFNDNDLTILNYIEKSLIKNNVIAPKIKAIYTLTHSNSEDASTE